MQAIPSPANCGSSECSETSTQIPGPAGANGTNGTNGTNGINAFTVTTSQFTMPAEGANVTVNLLDSTFSTVGQNLFIQFAGAFQVVSKGSSTTATLKNLGDVAGGYYVTNAPPGTVIPNASTVSPSGVQGATGATGGGGDLLAANNLSDVDSASTSRTNLGLGTMATQTATDYLSKAGNLSGLANTTTSRSNLGVAIGTDVQAYDADLAAIAGLTSAADRLPYFTGPAAAALAIFTSVARTLVAASTVIAQRAALGSVLPRYGCLAQFDAVNLNSAATDSAVTIESARYRIDKIVLESPSAAVTTATMGLFTAAGGSGTTLCADQALSGVLTSTTKFMDLVTQAIIGTDTRTNSTLYIRVGTAEGSARTVNVKIYGFKFD